VDFSPLLHLAERADGALTGMFAGQPLLVTLLVAAALGLRHASDPDHLVAITSLVAARGGGVRAAARMGAWWGAGHAVTLVFLGVPLILVGSHLPAWLEAGAERAIGVVIALLAARVLLKWVRGDYRAGAHRHPPALVHRHLRRGATAHHGHAARTPAQAFAIGVLHGLAGTGAVVLLLLAALPGDGGAVLALIVFAPMSVASMVACSAGFAWVLTRRRLAPVCRSVAIPALGTFGVLFGFWYAGLV
jgi:hypothetical protein